MRFITFILTLVCYFSPMLLIAQGQIHRPQNKPEQKSTTQNIPQNQNKIGISEPDGYTNGYGYVDLGLPSGTKWAYCNVNAKSPDQEGKIFGWGDPTGTKLSENSFDYPIKEPPLNICGDKRYDMAMVNMGYPWLLPNKNNFDELEKYCKWEKYTHNGVIGVKIIGPNGKSIFLPTTSHRALSSFNKEKGNWEILKTYPPSNSELQYYSGELNTNGGEWPAWNSRPYCLICFFYSNVSSSIQGGGLRCEAYPVRAVIK